MQVAPRKVLRQQVILKGLGFYSGPLDGIWGPQSKFERRLDMYRPARPVNGMPFAAEGPYPKGIYLVENGLLYHSSIEELKEEENAAVSKLKDSVTSAPVPQRVREAREKAAAQLQQPAVEKTEEPKSAVVQQTPKSNQNQQKNQR